MVKTLGTSATMEDGKFCNNRDWTVVTLSGGFETIPVLFDTRGTQCFQTTKPRTSQSPRSTRTSTFERRINYFVQLVWLFRKTRYSVNIEKLRRNSQIYIYLLYFVFILKIFFAWTFLIICYVWRKKLNAPQNYRSSNYRFVYVNRSLSKTK